MALTPKQRRFCAEYLIDLNATQAAIRAGYSKHTAKSQGQRLLTYVDIKAEVGTKTKKQVEKVDISAEYVLSSLKEVAERCRTAVPVMVREGRKLVQKIDEETGEGVWEFDSSGANRALELLGKHLAIFTDRLEVRASLEALLIEATKPPPSEPEAVRSELSEGQDSGSNTIDVPGASSEVEPK